MIAGPLPAADHLARARPEHAVGAARVEAERRQRHLKALALGLVEAKAFLRCFRLLLRLGRGSGGLVGLGRRLALRVLRRLAQCRRLGLGLAARFLLGAQPFGLDPRQGLVGLALGLGLGDRLALCLLLRLPQGGSGDLGLALRGLLRFALRRLGCLTLLGLLGGAAQRGLGLLALTGLGLLACRQLDLLARGGLGLLTGHGLRLAPRRDVGPQAGQVVLGLLSRRARPFERGFGLAVGRGLGLGLLPGLLLELAYLRHQGVRPTPLLQRLLELLRRHAGRRRDGKRRRIAAERQVSPGGQQQHRRGDRRHRPGADATAQGAPRRARQASRPAHDAGRLAAGRRRILAAQQGAPVGDALRPVLGPHRQPGVDAGQQGRRKPLRPQLDERHAGVLHDALDGARWRVAGDGVIQRGGETVDVAPRPEPDRGELFRRRVTRREDRRHGRGALRHRRARGAEIDQRRVTLLVDHDVGRLDVAVQEAHRVHLLEPVEQREQQLLDRLRPQALLALQALAERLALDQRHDHVGSAIGLEEVVDAHDRRREIEPRQGSGLLEEALAPPGELLGVLGRARHDGRVPLTQGKGRRQVLLDGNVAVQREVARPVGDAERALAQDARHLVATQLRAGRQHATQRALRHVGPFGDARHSGPHGAAPLLRREPVPGRPPPHFTLRRPTGRPRRG